MCCEKPLTNRLNCVTAVEVVLGRGLMYLCVQVTLRVTPGDAFGCEILGFYRVVLEVFAPLLVAQRQLVVL